jgi:hypothetical protein
MRRQLSSMRTVLMLAILIGGASGTAAGLASTVPGPAFPSAPSAGAKTYVDRNGVLKGEFLRKWPEGCTPYDCNPVGCNPCGFGLSNCPPNNIPNAQECQCEFMPYVLDWCYGCPGPIGGWSNRAWFEWYWRYSGGPCDQYCTGETFYICQDEG